MPPSRRVTALDLGTTKVCCAVADVDSDRLTILGVGIAASRGIRKGMVVDIERAAESVAEAIDAAETMANIAIDSAVVGMSGGGQITSVSRRGSVTVGSPRHQVREQDVSRAVAAARHGAFVAGQEILHVLPRAFTVDGQQGVREAVGMSGTQLEVETHIVAGASTAIQNVIRVMHQAGLDVDDLVLQGLASAEAVLSDEELERGVAVADIGGGTTDMAIFHGGSIAHTAVIPVGGNHFTGDLSVGLRCDLETAERIKCSHGHCVDLSIEPGAEVMLTPMGFDEPVALPQRYLAEVIGPRAREMAELIAAEIEGSGAYGLLPAGIVLTGGGARLRGLAEIVHQITGLPVRLAVPGNTAGNGSLRGAEHAAVVGLLNWGARTQRKSDGAPSSNGHRSGSRVRRWFREFF